MAQVWNLPGPARPGYLQRLGRAALFLGVLGLGVIVTTLLTGLGAYGHHAIAVAVLLEALAAAANIGMYFIGFRVLTPKGVPARKLVPGAVAGGVAWTVLQAAGTYVVHHFLHSDSVYGVFATVLGLLAWIYLGVEITVYAAETNVVLARRLWPRSIVQPPLTRPGRRATASPGGGCHRLRATDQRATSQPGHPGTVGKRLGPGAPRVSARWRRPGSWLYARQPG
jgi:hypothetical protein